MKISHLSRRVVLSYVLDWLIIILIAAAGGGLNYISGYNRAFSLLDLSISYPYVQESISTAAVGIACLLSPAIIIALIVLIFIPGRSVARTLNRRDFLALKLWEFEKGWAGLCLSIALAFFITQAMKNMFGKPRPNCIQTCMPDLENIGQYVVGGFGQDISPRWVLVSSRICTNPDKKLVRDAFRSFPSGHSSFSWSGLLYLTLYLCSKFHIAVPYLPFQLSGRTAGYYQSAENGEHEMLPLHHQRGESTSSDTGTKGDEVPFAQQAVGPKPDPEIPVRNQAASPPVYLLVLAAFPIAVAIYIVSTRYVEYYHKGFDLIFGSLIGILSAWLSFRWYHLPFGRGEGWAWGPRSRDRAFGISVGPSGYVSQEGWGTARKGVMGNAPRTA